MSQNEPVKVVDLNNHYVPLAIGKIEQFKLESMRLTEVIEKLTAKASEQLANNAMDIDSIMTVLVSRALSNWVRRSQQSLRLSSNRFTCGRSC